MNIGIGKFIRDGFTLESIESAFRRLAAAVAAGWEVEHKPDGTHSQVTADTITLSSTPDNEDPQIKIALPVIDTVPSTSNDVQPQIVFDVADGQSGMYIYGLEEPAGSVVLHGHVLGPESADSIGISWTAAGSTFGFAEMQVFADPTNGNRFQVDVQGGSAGSRIPSVRMTASSSGAADPPSVVATAQATGNAAATATFQSTCSGSGIPTTTIKADSNTTIAVVQLIADSTTVTVDDTGLSINESIAATDGFFERSRTTAVGEWIAVAYAAGNFTASAGTWTVDSGDQVTYAYTLIGKTMTVMFFIQTTDVSNAASLRIAIPGGFTAAKATRNLIQVLDAGNPLTGMAVVAASGTYIECYASVGAATFNVTAADNTYVIGQITFEVS